MWMSAANPILVTAPGRRIGLSLTNVRVSKTIMNLQPEKRRHVRHTCEGSISLSFANCQSAPIDANLLNLSKEGLSFLTAQPLSPGTTIIVRATDAAYRTPADDSDCQLRTMGFATIKWHCDDSGPGRTLHRMGAVYVLPR